jgi:small subunit ribosomal protein S4
MGRYLGPKHKLCRRVGEKICSNDKCPVARRPFKPGVHGPTSRTRLTGYGIQLIEKQKAKMIYGLLERQFRKYVEMASNSKENTTDVLLRLLETRLDNVVYRLGVAKTRGQARQYVGHGHFTVNGRKVNVPSIALRVGDVIGVRPESAKSKIFEGIKERLAGSTVELPVWLTFDLETLTAKVVAMPKAADAQPLFDSKQIIELYSR